MYRFCKNDGRNTGIIAGNRTQQWAFGQLAQNSCSFESTIPSIQFLLFQDICVHMSEYYPIWHCHCFLVVGSQKHWEFLALLCRHPNWILPTFIDCFRIDVAIHDAQIAKRLLVGRNWCNGHNLNCSQVILIHHNSIFCQFQLNPLCQCPRFSHMLLSSPLPRSESGKVGTELLFYLTITYLKGFSCVLALWCSPTVAMVHSQQSNMICKNHTDSVDPFVSHSSVSHLFIKFNSISSFS